MEEIEETPNVSKLNNKDLIKSALKDLEEETNFKFYDIKYGNGYFIYEFEDYSVCWFKVKEIPNFRFGIWLSCNYNHEGYDPEFKDSELILFAQHELTLDKFKPSNSALKIPMYRYMIKPNNSKVWKEEWNDYSAIKLLKFMKNHKYTAFTLSNFSDFRVYDYVTPLYCFMDYVKTKIYYSKENFIKGVKFNFLKLKIYLIFQKLKCVKYIISDYGECWSPRIHITCFVDETSLTKDELNRVDKYFDYFNDKLYMSVSFTCRKSLNDLKDVYDYHCEKEDIKVLWKNL